MAEPDSSAHYALRFQIADRTLASFTLKVPSLSCPVGAADIHAYEGVEPPSNVMTKQGLLLRSVPSASAQQRLQRQSGWIRYVLQTYNRCFIDLQQSFGDYKSKFSSKTRSTIARKIKKWIEHTGEPLRWTCYCTEADMSNFHPLARAVSERTYQEKLMDGGLPGDVEFLNQMQRDAAAGNARGYILFHGDRPVSYLYCPVVDEVVIYDYLGYDPSYLKHSVGTVLQWLALESLFAEQRFKFFDFTEGETDHKRLFATHLRPSANVLYLIDSPWHRLLVTSHLTFDLAVARLRDLAAQSGLISKLRRWQRFGRGSGDGSA